MIDSSNCAPIHLNPILMPSPKIFLLAAAAGLTPIALSYGAKPSASIPFLFDFPVDGVNETHIFRAVMGLYMAQAVFWIAGALKPALTTAALWSVIVFMWGLALGRLISLIVDGMPRPILVVYLLLEVGFGVIGCLILRKQLPRTPAS